MFSVVEFTESTSVSAVSHSWVESDGKMCWWPNNFSQSKFDHAIKTHAKPIHPGWNLFACRVMKQNIGK